MENSHIINIHILCVQQSKMTGSDTDVTFKMCLCVFFFSPVYFAFTSNGITVRVHSMKATNEMDNEHWIHHRFNRLCEHLASCFVFFFRFYMIWKQFFFVIHVCFFFRLFNMYFQLPNLNSSSHCFFLSLFELIRFFL